MAKLAYAATTVNADDARALFEYWRGALMGSLTPKRTLPLAVGGYFFEQCLGAGAPQQPIPLGEVRRDLVAIVDRSGLSPDNRSLVDLYYGLSALPLPFSSTRSPDIAAGREETKVRAACRAAVEATAAHISRREVGPTPVRPAVNPVQQDWFLNHSRLAEAKARTVDRAYVRARVGCDGAYAGPTLAALEKWYADSGYGDPELIGSITSRPNANALARASALMEVALYDEVRRASTDRYKPRQPAVPTSVSIAATGHAASTSEPNSAVAPEVVIHPDLVALLHNEELTTTGLVKAAAALQDRASNGHDVSGRVGLLQRILRTRLDIFTPYQVERVAVSVSYMAVAMGDPFLALEWLGHFLDRVGITDRTFTVVVNASEAAAVGGYHALASSVDRYFHHLRRRWAIPDHQIPLVEHTEAEQQRLVASSYRLELLARDQFAAGDLQAGTDTISRSMSEAVVSAQVAYQVLTDRVEFPERTLPGKASAHGGDLAWPWLLGAVLRATEAAAVLADNIDADNEDARTLDDLEQRIHVVARFAHTAIAAYDEPITVARFMRWRAEAGSTADRLSGWTPGKVAT